MYPNNKKHFLINSIVFLVALFLINFFALGSFYESIFLDLNKTIFEPVLYWAVCVALCSFILIALNESIYQAWFKRIFRWYLPLGLVLTFLTSTTLSYTFPDRLGVATLLGWGLVILTVGFVLVQLVLDWKKK
jgi:hypothetical protein